MHSGWHHDDVSRTTVTGQPNYINPEYKSEHLLGLVNGDICPTLFIDGEVTVSNPDIDKTIYEVWDSEIEKNLAQYNVVSAQSGRYIQFDSNAFHTGQMAIENGWRWFIRLSRNTDRQKKITNEIRRQAQVYMPFPKAGW